MHIKSIVGAVWRFITKSRYSIWIKLGFSILFFSLFIRQVDFGRLSHLLRDFSLASILVLVFVSLFRHFLGAVRFHVLLKLKHRVSVLTLTKHYFIATFFNNFLPTAVGGDAMRIGYLHYEGVSKMESTFYVFTERLIGFYAFTVIAFVSSFFWHPPTLVFQVACAIMLAYSAGIALFLLYPSLGIWKKNKLLQRVNNEVRLVRSHPVRILKVFLLSIIYQFSSIFISYWVAYIIHPELSIVPFLTLVPLVWLITMIPISLGGIGLREFSFIQMMSILNLKSEDGLLISLGTYFTLIFISLIGFVVFLIDSTARKERNRGK